MVVALESRYLALMDRSVVGSPRPWGTLGRCVLSLSLDEANTWLNRTWPDFIRRQGSDFPRKIDNLMASAERGDIALRGRFRTLEFTRVLTLVLNIDFAVDGKARIRMQCFRGGELPLTFDMLMGLLKKNAAIGSINTSVDRMVELFEAEAVAIRFVHDETLAVLIVALEMVNDRGTCTSRSCREPVQSRARWI